MIRYFIVGFALILSGFVYGQNGNINIQDGYAAEGYDVVAYFGGHISKGLKEYRFMHDGVSYLFSKPSNLAKFRNNPEQYLPQYGGYCAYAMGKNGKKVSIDPETYEIRDGKLYLFYNSFFNNTLDDWLEEGPEKLRIQADKNWEKIIKKGK